MTKDIDQIETLLKAAADLGNKYNRSWASLAQPWYDHRYDWARGPVNWMWMERGILGMKCIREGDRVLDLFCGDGSFPGLFFSRLAKHVDGVDRNSSAIALANSLYSRPNVTFHEADVVKERFPSEYYDVVTFFEGIEHLSIEEGNLVLSKIVDCLLGSTNGTLIGSTPLGHGGNPEHQNEFDSVEYLREFLVPHFDHVEFWLSRWSAQRTEIYFTCK